MCGIAGFIWKDKSRPANISAVNRMNQIQFHRGPDDCGIFQSGPLALGHRRLAILDLSPAGRQPMISHNGQTIIIFNGEIYNYKEIRSELESCGYIFDSNTDTEVILNSYQAWGEKCVHKFNGMWAFAIYDLSERRIFLSRDRFGIKPLYFHLDHQSFVFASEIKAILAAKPESRKPNLPYLARFIPSGIFDDGPETFFKDIQSLEPGCNAQYCLETGGFSRQKYWEVDLLKFRHSWIDQNPEDYLWDLLNSSVRLHLRSDVPVGSCLSGGIDSSTLVYLMAAQVAKPIRTFSGIYPDKECNEKKYIDLVNAEVSTIPFTISPEPQRDLIEDLEKITWHQDEPTAGAGLYTQYHVMRRANGNVKVLLDGQGADELFGGYIWYFRFVLSELVSKKSIANLFKTFNLLLEIRRHWGLKIIPDWHVLLSQRNQRLSSFFSFLKKKHNGFQVTNILHNSLVDILRKEPIQRIAGQVDSDPLNQTLYEQITKTSLPALLHYEDRNSMAFSIEARVPFLDHRIVEFALSLAANEKISGTWTKYLLRKTSSRIIHPKIAWRKNKMGYPTPMARWLRDEKEKKTVEDFLFSATLTNRGLFKPEKLKLLWRSHQEGNDHSWLIYRIITTELWFRNLIDRLNPVSALPIKNPSKLAA